MVATPFAKKKLTHAILLGLALGSSISAMPRLHAAEQQANTATQQYAIAAGTLDSALGEFGRITGRMVAIDPALTNGIGSKGLQGRYTEQQALSALLLGTGLQAISTESGSYRLRKTSNLAEHNTSSGAGNSVLPEISVRASAERETATGPLQGYVATRASSATKSDASLLETPQSISVVTSNEIRNRQADTLSQALSYTPGFTSQPTSFNRTADRFRIRGFDVESATGGSIRDGMRLQINSYDGTQEPYGLERVEVLRGAASVLYGQLSPGGLVNGISKRPTEIPLHELSLQLGQYDRKQLSADFSGPVADTDTLSYRLTMLARESDTAQDHIKDDKVYIAPALTWKPNDKTSLTLLSFYRKSETRFAAPLPYQLTKGIGSGRFTIGRHDFIGEPSYDKMNGEMSSLGYEFEHAFTPDLKLTHKLRYYESDVQWNYLQAVTNNVAINNARNNGILARQYSDRRERSRVLSTDTALQSKWHLGNAEHTVLLGIDAYNMSYDSHNFRGNVSALNLATYNYGQPVIVNKSLNQERGSQIDTLQKGIYLQDQVRYHNWVGVLGVRRDWAEQDQEFFRNGSKAKQNNTATTWRAGLVYQADNGLAPYFSYSESFLPIAVADAAGQSFSPTEGKQYEAGLRYQPPGSKILLSAAVFELRQKNVLRNNPATQEAFQTGEIRSRGLELEAKAELANKLTLTTTYAYIDARITKSVNPAEVGQRSEDTPYHQAAVWGHYNFASLGLPELTLGTGARYKGTTQASGMDFGMPSYILVDAMATYQLNPRWELLMTANNLTNKQYTYCEFAICRFGDERRVMTNLTYRW